MSFTFSWGCAHIYNHIAQVYPQPLKYLYAFSFILNNPWTDNIWLLKYTIFFCSYEKCHGLNIDLSFIFPLKIICPPPQCAALSWSWWIPNDTSFGLSSPMVCEQCPRLLSRLSGHAGVMVSHRRWDPPVCPWQHSPGALRQESKERTWEQSGSTSSPGHTRAANTFQFLSEDPSLSVFLVLSNKAGLSVC